MISRKRKTSKLKAGALLAAITGALGNAASAALPQTELDALTAIYNGLNGDNWVVNTGWNSATDPCSGWHGITCNAAATNVVELDLYNNNARGFISPQIANLTELEVIDFALTRLDGTSIPPELGSLSKLRTLYITDAFLTGPIPVELGQLSNLTALYLDDNFFLDGEIPSELGNLSSLVELRLYNNQFSGRIPDSFSGLTALADLRLYNNNLTGEIPSFVGSLPQLEYINIDWNALHSNDATLNTQINQLLFETEGADYLETQTLDAEASSADIGETAIRLRWTAINTIPASIGGYKIYRSDTEDGEFQFIKDVPVKTSNSTFIDGLTAETTYFFKVLSFTDDVEIVSIKEDIVSSGDLHPALEVTTLATGSGNTNVDDTEDQQEEQQPDPVDPTTIDNTGDPDNSGDNSSGGSGGGGGAPLMALLALVAVLIPRGIKRR